MKKLEVIAVSIEDIKNLNNTLIDRVEYCSNIEEDGLTPSKEEVLEVLEVTKKPVNIMVRPRNSFYLTEEDKVTNLEFIKWLENIKKQYKYLNGIVIGYLTEENKVDEEFLKEVSEICKELKITFHKASDILINNGNYKKLKEYNITTILTQGGLSTIDSNMSKIKELKQEFPNLEILLGGGINEENIKGLLELDVSIHIGSLARVDKSYKKEYNMLYLNKIKRELG